MDQLWRISKWVRLHDWEWGDDADRRRLFPSRFFYHVLRLGQIKADGIKGYSGAVDYLDYDPIHHQILTRRRNPGPSLEAATPPMSSAFETLRERGFLIPADADEPADHTAIFHATVLLCGIQQLEDEFVPALRLVGEVEPRTVLEIGTAQGGSLFAWAQVAHPEAHIVSFDLLGGPQRAGYTKEYARRLKQFCAPGQRLSCFLGRSQSPYIVRQLRSLLDGESVDLLYIDGDHSYKGVTLDFKNYAPLVRPGGLIVFHDICHPEDHPTCAPPGGVDRFWNEVKKGYDYQEIVRDGEDGAHLGIGILHT